MNELTCSEGGFSEDRSNLKRMIKNSNVMHPLHYMLIRVCIHKICFPTLCNVSPDVLFLVIRYHPTEV